MDQQGRRSLPHGVPLWVDPARSVYFVTIGCKQRGVNQLCIPEVGDRLLASAQFYREQDKWFPLLFLLMPDHLHMLVTFSREQEITKVVTAWKRYAATQWDIVWQQGFFEHRLRKDESLREKSDYILQNSVRAGLVADPAEWPFVLKAD